MLRSLKVLEHFRVNALDGDIGSVANFLIDDATWTVRYLVVNTGSVFNGRDVLISPISFGRVDFSASRLHLSLSTDKVKNSPSIDLHLPVTRQHERDYYGYYGYPHYWGHGEVWGKGEYPSAMASAVYPPAEQRPGEPPADPHLRSAKELTGYHIEATDGAIGHVGDFIVDDETWGIRYMVVATSNWWPGKSVLIAPAWASRIAWLDRKVYVDMTQDAVKRSPEWSATFPVKREYEALLHRHYGRTPGWASRDRSFSAHAPRHAAPPRT